MKKTKITNLIDSENSESIRINSYQRDVIDKLESRLKKGKCTTLLFYSTPNQRRNPFFDLMKEDDSKKTTTTKKGT